MPAYYVVCVQPDGNNTVRRFVAVHHGAAITQAEAAGLLAPMIAFSEAEFVKAIDPWFMPLDEDEADYIEDDDEADVCDECGAEYPDDATGHLGPWHKEHCTLYQRTIP